MKTIEIEHNGYTATLEWREESDDWRAAWWLTLRSRPFCIGQGDPDDLIARVKNQFIGSPPPEDHSIIYGIHAAIAEPET